MIYFLSERHVRNLARQAEINDEIEAIFRAMAEGEARNFPLVREKLGYQQAIFGFKSGFDSSGPTLGVKAGGLWPGNRAKGLANHQSTIVLFDPETGGPHALVCGTYLTALRTAAASALSIRYLARTDCRTLGVLGAGGQAEHQIRAALAERPFERVLIANRTRQKAEAVARILDGEATVKVVDVDTLCAESDALITVALSFEPLIRAEQIRPGTHVALMGTDTVGKQEVDAALFAEATVFGDAPDQNAHLGECQHAVREGIISQDAIVPLGDVIAGAHPGRTSDREITLFDSTGMGLQDLAAARLMLSRALQSGDFVELDNG